MKETYIFGHKNPDTDSICSAIGLSYLKNKLGSYTTPCRIGAINEETRYALNYFKTEVPLYLNDVKLTLDDIDYHRNLFINEHSSLYEAYILMTNNNISGIPVVDDKKHLVGMITLKEILTHMINDELRNLHTSYDNILKVINGKELLRFDDEIVGNMKLASFRSTTVRETLKFDEKDILILADRHSIIELAIESGVKLIILTGSSRIKDEHLELAKQNKVNIIRTTLSTFYVTNRIYLANYINKCSINGEPVYFKTTDYVSDFKRDAQRIKHTNYPIVNMNGECSGILRMADIESNNPKRVILVDHNEQNQSAEGLTEANILEIVDHHKIGNISSKNPINFRNMAVGSTCTIVYKLFKENKVKIPTNIAGLLLSGILSDTLLLKSPTTTYIDEEVVSELEKYLKIDALEYGLEMYKNGASIKGKSIKEVFNTDYKVIDTSTTEFGVSQVFTLNIDDIENNKQEYIDYLNKTKEDNNLISVSMFVTDIIKESSYIYFDESSKSLLEEAFEITDLYQGYELKGIVSRKKQIVPRIMNAIEK